MQKIVTPLRITTQQTTITPSRLRKSVCALLFVGAIFVLFSCVKDEAPIPEEQEQDAVTLAKTFFEVSNSAASTDTAALSYQLGKGSELLWSAAELREKSDTTIVFVPVETSGDYFAADETAGAHHRMTTQLRAFKAGQPIGGSTW